MKASSASRARGAISTEHAETIPAPNSLQQTSRGRGRRRVRERCASGVYGIRLERRRTKPDASQNDDHNPRCAYFAPHLAFVQAALVLAFIGATSLWAKSEQMPPEESPAPQSFSTPVPLDNVRARDAAGVPVPLPGASTRIDEIKQRGSLRVAVLEEYPWLKQNLAGERPFEGPAWRLAEEFAKRLRVRLETIPVGFDNKVSILASGQVDITIAPLLDTLEREKVVDFVLYSVSAQCLFGLADNPKVIGAAKVDDLNRSGITIAYIIGSPQESWLRKRLPNAAMRGVHGSLADVPVGEILSRRADVAPIDKFFFAGLAQKTPGLVSVPKDFLSSQESSIPVGMAIDKNQPVFLEWLREVAKAIKPQVDAEQIRVERADKTARQSIPYRE